MPVVDPRSTSPSRFPRGRAAFSALEVVFATFLLGVVLLPLSELVQTSRRASRFTEVQLVSQRQAQATLASLSSLSLPELRKLCLPPSSPIPKDPRLGAEAQEVQLPLRVGKDILLDALEPEDADLLVSRMQNCRVFLEPLEPGLLRLSVYLWWSAGPGRRSLVVSRLIEDPFHPREVS